MGAADADADADSTGAPLGLDAEDGGEAEASAESAPGGGVSPESLSQAATQAASTRAKPEARTRLPRAAHLHFLMNWPGVHFGGRLGLGLGLVLGGGRAFIS